MSGGTNTTSSGSRGCRLGGAVTGLMGFLVEMAFPLSVALQEEIEELGSPTIVLSSPLSLLDAAVLRVVGDGPSQESHLG